MNQLSESTIFKTAKLYDKVELEAGVLGKVEVTIYKVDSKLYKNRFFMRVAEAFAHENSESIQFFLHHEEYGVENTMYSYFLRTLKGVEDEDMRPLKRYAAILQKNYERKLKYGTCDYDSELRALKWFEKVYQVNYIDKK